MKSNIVLFQFVFLFATACATEVTVEIPSNLINNQSISPSKHFVVENDAVNRYLNEVHYNGFRGSVITKYAIESGYRMDWPREFSISLLPTYINSDVVFSYKIWERWNDTMISEGEGPVSHIQNILNYLQPGNAYVYELTGKEFDYSIRDTLQIEGQTKMI